jgi:hypothetical protein
MRWPWVVVAMGPTMALAAPERKTILAARAGAAPVIDGRLDDPAWLAATPDDRFVQRRPLEDRPPSERTEVRVLYDDAALYVGFDCADGDPDGVVARLTRRDRPIESDWVGFLVDSRDDATTGYVFRVNAAGVKFDELYFDDIMSSTDWDAVWDVATRRHAGGWTAEFRVPLSVLRFAHKPVNEWGFQAARWISRKQEEIFWSQVPRNAQAFVSLSGRLTGLSDLRPRRTFELRPYVLARATAATPSGGAFLGLTTASPDVDGSVDAGLDLKLGLTSDLTLDATVNPDFGQVEADQVILNLTRFETFFAEKRPFFLESFELFAMPVQLFYTRRIGQPRPGDAPPRILGAAKVTGKLVSRLRTGLVGAVTDERSYVVARPRWEFADGSGLGALATAMTWLDPRPEDHAAFAQGIDFMWRARPGWRVVGQAFLSEREGGAATTRTDGTVLGPGDVGFGAHLFTQAQWKRYFVRAYLQSLSPQLDLNDVGFLPQFNEHRLYGLAGLVDYQPWGPLRTYNLLPGATVAMTHDGVLTEAQAFVYTEALFENYFFLSLEPGLSYGGAYNVHETFDGSRYERVHSVTTSLVASTDARAPVVLSAQGRAGLGVDGSYDFSGKLEAALNGVPRLELSLTPEAGVNRSLRFHDASPGIYRFGRLDSAFLSFTLRGTWTFSPDLSLTSYAQLFMDRGAWSRFRVLETDVPRPTIRRDDLVPVEGMGDDFQDVSLNVNVVLRWELVPGTTLIGVFTRAQQARAPLEGERPRLTPHGLARGPTEDVLLLKLVYFLGG